MNTPIPATRDVVVDDLNAGDLLDESGARLVGNVNYGGRGEVFFVVRYPSGFHGIRRHTAGAVLTVPDSGQSDVTSVA